jgi:phosphoadenosine phosphosulfate reductase
MAAEFVLIIGPCGAGKTTYARQHYPEHLHPDMEAMMHTFFSDPATFHYYPAIRTCGALLVEQAVQHLLAKKQVVCLTISGATRASRMKWTNMAFDAGVDVQCIRLLVDSATCVARAKADKTRPVSSRGHWQEIVLHWFRDFEPVDCYAENIAALSGDQLVREIECLQHRLHARLPAFARKVERAQAIIATAMQQMRTPYLAFSGGVDSTVLLDLVWQAGHRIPVLWGDDGYDYPETLDFLTATEQRYGFALQRIRCMQPWHDWCVEMARPDLCDDPAALRAWGNPCVWGATWNSLKDAHRERGYDGVFLGLLASESRGRGYVLKEGRHALYQVQDEGGMWHCSPLAAWTKQDVWAYVVLHSLPYNAAYDKLAALDIPLEHRRVAPLTCFRTVQYGSHAGLKAGWPDLYNQLAATFPRVRAFI